MTELAQQIIAENKAKHARGEDARVLDLGNCGLTELPDLSGMDWLETLIVSNEWWDMEKQEWLSSQNNGPANRITHSPSTVPLSLKNVIMGGNIGDNWQISDISFLQNLYNLTTLNLSYNQISDIRFLQNLYNLTTLNVHNNQISDGSYIQNLKNLTTLYISYNQITDTSFLKNLNNITTLNIHNNQISNANSLKNLNNLTTLSISDNKIRNANFLQNLNNLTTLYIHNNQISDASPIQNLNNLTTLYISNNKISDASFTQNLKSLTTLYISSNKISNLEPFLLFIKKEIPINLKEYNFNGINLYNNPITNPPLEIVSQGNAAILRYFEDLEKQGTDQIYEAKLLLIGEGGAGKTTLCKKLFDANAPMPEEEKDRTKGIDIHPLYFDIPSIPDKQFRLNIWDFAGQGKYQSTHSFFFSHRSLYVLVDDTRTLNEDDAYRSLYNNWLQTAELYGGNSPVLVLHNEKKGCARTGFSLSSFQDRFPFVHGELFRINLGGGETDKIEDLRRQIERRALALPHIGDTVPKTWVKVREALEVEKKDHPYISVERYRELCAAAGIKDPERQSDLSHYFHDLGIFLHFRENPLLKRDVFLQNTWVTDTVYKILDDAQIAEIQHGRFTLEDLNRLWPENIHRERRDELLALMLQFELCFHVQDSEIYICPQLLPGDVPGYNLGTGIMLQLKYDYEYVPKGLLYRLMVRLHRHIAQGQTAVWNAGVVLERAGSMAEITESLDRRTISVRATGLRAKELVTIINEELERLHAPFGERLKVEVKIPCNCRICHKSKNPHFYVKTDLDTRVFKGKTTVECSVSYDDVPVLGLLDGVFVPIIPIQDPIKLDAESKERILVGEVTVLIAKAGQIGREKNVGDHGIDMEVEFKADNGNATGKFVYLQLKSGDSYLNRQKDGIEYFKIPKDRHFDYWKDIIAPVILVIRRSNGEILWMEIQEFLRQQFTLGNRPKTIPFSGEKLTPESVLQWRAKVLGNG